MLRSLFCSSNKEQQQQQQQQEQQKKKNNFNQLVSKFGHLREASWLPINPTCSTLVCRRKPSLEREAHRHEKNMEWGWGGSLMHRQIHSPPLALCESGLTLFIFLKKREWLEKNDNLCVNFVRVFDSQSFFAKRKKNALVVKSF